MAVQLVFPEIPNYSSSYTLEGVEYILNIRYNSRDDTWRVNINNAEGAPILNGLRCMPDAYLTNRYSREGTGLFSGDLLCIDTENGTLDTVNRDNFGTDKRYQLWYLTQNEINSLGG